MGENYASVFKENKTESIFPKTLRKSHSLVSKDSTSEISLHKLNTSKIRNRTNSLSPSSTSSFTRAVLMESPRNDKKSFNKNNLEFVSNSIDNLKDDFLIKKECREKLSNEFKDMLSQSFRKNSSDNTNIQSSNIKRDIKKTDDNNLQENDMLVIPNLQLSCKKGNNSGTSYQKTSNENVSCKRLKFYDPKIAREYMKQQQIKRKLKYEKSKEFKKDPEEIKKRLKELREVTLKLVSKNVEQSKNRKNKEFNRKPIKKVPVNHKTKEDTKIAKKETKDSKKEDDLIVKYEFLNTGNKIGILRNLESETYPFRPKMNGTLKKIKKPETETNENIEKNISNEFDLKVPDVKLKLNSEKDLNVEIPQRKQENPNVSYLLKPNLIQKYPYNFIIALRKKLDSIVTPSLDFELDDIVTRNHTKENLEKDDKQMSEIDKFRQIRGLNFDKFINHNRGTNNNDERSVKKNDLNNLMQHSDEQDNESPDKKHINREQNSFIKSSTSEMINSNFSSITINIPESNTTSEVSSIKSEVIKASELLCSTKIESNENKSIKKSSAEIPNQTNLDIQSTMKSYNGKKSENDLSNLEFQKMLTSFNQSLNHVIEMNKKLYTALQNPLKNLEQLNSLKSVCELKNQQTSPIEFSNSESQMNSRNSKENERNENNKSIDESNIANEKSEISVNYSDNFDPDDEANDTRDTSERDLRDTYIVTRSAKVTPKSDTNITFSDRDESLNSNEAMISTASMNNSSSTVVSNRNNVEENEIVPILNLIPPINSLSSNSTIKQQRTDKSQSKSKSSVHTILNTFNEKSNNEDLNNTTIGSDLYNIFNNYEYSYNENMSLNNSDMSLSYSMIGFYDNAIKNEIRKTKHLADLMKIREKSMIDSTRGQIALLEIQKKKFKESGKIDEVSMIRKKQRALLLRLEKQREEIYKILKKENSNHKSNRKSKNLFDLNSPTSSTSILTVKKLSKNLSLSQSISNKSSSGPIPCYDIKASNANLENLLNQRELELKKRRENVEMFLKWHKRLDDEENEIKSIEKKLLKFNLNKFNEKNKKLNEIDSKLKMIKQITNTSSSSPSKDYDKESGNDKDEVEEESVLISGDKLNKLWYRLTGEKSDNKYNSNERYTLTKTDLERIYEDAKQSVLNNNISNILNDDKISLNDLNKNTESNTKNSKCDDDVVVSYESTPEYTEFELYDSYSSVKINSNLSSNIQSIHTISRSSPTPKNYAEDSDNHESKSEIKEETEDYYIKNLYLDENSMIEDVSFPYMPDMSSITDSHIKPQNKIDENLSQSISSEDINEFDEDSNNNSNDNVKNEIEQRLIMLDEGLKDLNKSFEKLPNELKSPISSQSSSRCDDIESVIDDDQSSLQEIKKETTPQLTTTFQQIENHPILLRNKNINDNFPTSTTNHHYQNGNFDVEKVSQSQFSKPPVNHIENSSSSHLYIREIPNKPPPPYVPPAVDSQFAAVFPSEDRIHDIVMRQTREIYEKEFLNKNSSNSLINENITNIFERIILDVCKELILELKPQNIKYSSMNIKPFKNKLSLYNPSTRLEAIQKFILKKVNKLLSVENRGQCQNTSNQQFHMMNFRKRELVDVILINELIEDEENWLNYDLEECEVKDKVTEEIWDLLVEEAFNDVIHIIRNKKVCSNL